MGFLRAGSKYKFLRIHTGRHDLPYFYHPYIDTMVSFFDCFLRDDDHGGWKTGREPPVKYAVRRGTAPMGTLDESDIFQWRSEQEWPLTRTKYQKLHLHADQSLRAISPSMEGQLSYKTGLRWEALLFLCTFADNDFKWG